MLARRDRDRAGSGGESSTQPEAQIAVPAAGGESVAEGRAEVLRILSPGTVADDTATAISGRPR